VDIYINSIAAIDTDLLSLLEQQQLYYMLAASLALIIAIVIIKVYYMKIRLVVWKILDLHGKIDKNIIQNRLSLLSQFKQVLKNEKNKSNEILDERKREDHIKHAHDSIPEPVVK
jgi:low affinity Fe/Cu permease